MRTVWRWLELRLELKDTLRPLLAHPIPRALDGRVGWFYVLGVSVLAAFVIQVVSGVALAITYVPSSESAYDSLKFITDSAALGRFIRGVHWFGACAMVLLIVAHVTRVFLMGAYANCGAIVAGGAGPACRRGGDSGEAPARCVRSRCSSSSTSTSS